MVSEAGQVLAVSFQDAGVWYAAAVYDSVEVEIGFAGKEEAENPRTGRSENLEAHSGSGIEVAADSERVEGHFETDSVVRFGKEAVRSGIVEDHCGMEEDRFGIGEAVHSGTEVVESRARLVERTVEAAQTLDYAVD